MKKTIKNLFFSLSIAVTIIFSSFSNVYPGVSSSVENNIPGISCCTTPEKPPTEIDIISPTNL